MLAPVLRLDIGPVGLDLDLSSAADEESGMAYPFRVCGVPGFICMIFRERVGGGGSAIAARLLGAAEPLSFFCGSGLCSGLVRERGGRGPSSISPEPGDEEARVKAAGGSVKRAFSEVKEALSLPLISVEAGGVGGKAVGGIAMEDRVRATGRHTTRFDTGPDR